MQSPPAGHAGPPGGQYGAPGGMHYQPQYQAEQPQPGAPPSWPPAQHSQGITIMTKQAKILKLYYNLKTIFT